MIGIRENIGNCADKVAVIRYSFAWVKQSRIPHPKLEDISIKAILSKVLRRFICYLILEIGVSICWLLYLFPENLTIDAQNLSIPAIECRQTEPRRQMAEDIIFWQCQ